MGDTAVIDFEGFDDGKPFEGGKGEDYSLEIGSGSFVPGFEDQLIGLKAGDEKDLDITFPEDYVRRSGRQERGLQGEGQRGQGDPGRPRWTTSLPRTCPSSRLWPTSRRTWARSCKQRREPPGPERLRERRAGAAHRQHGGRDPRRHGGDPAGQDHGRVRQRMPARACPWTTT